MSGEIRAEKQRGSFLSRLLWTFHSPTRLYGDIAAGSPWWQPWVWVSIVNGVVAWVSLPIQIRLASLNPRDVPEEQLDQSLEMMEKFGFLGVISTPVVVLITSLIIAGISYLIVSMLAESPSFKKYFTLYLYCSVVSSLGLLVSTLITRLRGLDVIRSMEDAFASLGPAAFLSPGHKVLYPILSNFDLFDLWFYILLGAGVSHVFRLTSRSAFLVVLPVWLLFVLFALIGTRFGGMS